ncbi:MAG TPA: hypothetical protein VFV87_14520 [Pirellulaceae bacterium]|nr:hypothetical protein [Pirellulaceae bacterium]
MRIVQSPKSKAQSLAVVLVGAMLALPAIVWAESSDARFLDGLRQRQLFELAEEYCSYRLARSVANGPIQADLSIELIRTLALHATNVPPAERDGPWAKARSVAAEFAARKPPHPRAILVRLQDALTPLAQGELARQELEAGALTDDRLEQARAALRESRKLFDELSQELAREIPFRRRTAPEKGELSADQLFNLQQHVQYQLARAQRNQALLFAKGSDDRLALLLAAVETLQGLMSQIAADEPLMPQVQLDLSECQRLLGRLAEAEEIAGTLDREGVPPAVRLRARAELLRSAIAEEDLSAIQKLLALGREVDGEAAADLDFAWFEAFLAQARLASEGMRAAGPKPAAEVSKQFQDQAAAAADFLEESYGPYWGRRANQLLIASLPRGGRGNVQLLARAADSLYLKGEFEQAIAAYDEAAAQARQSSDLAASFDLAYKAALIEQKRERHAQAAQRLRILSKSFATHAQAAPAHLLAAWNAAQAARDNAAAADSYAAILREHLATWPAAESADQARIWLGKIEESQSNWADATEAYSGVPRSSPHFAAAAVGLARCWPKRLAGLSSAGKPTAGVADEAIQALQRALLDPENRLPQTWTESDRAVALALAELIVGYQPASSADAVKILEAASNTSDATAEWKAAAQIPLVLALANQPVRREEAVAALGRLAKENPNSGAIQERYADLLLAAHDAASLQQALERWRVIASRSQPRTERWYKAKLSIAQAQYLLGEKHEAAVLLHYLLETQPSLKGTAWETAYRELLGKCEAR